MFFDTLTIDLSFWTTFLQLSLLEQAKVIFALGLWLPLASFMFTKGAAMWVDYRTKKGIAHWEWVLLAVDIPPMFIQSPKAVEQIFAQISGTLGHADVQAKFWTGHKQKTFSFEIISIEGYIQFLIRTEKEYRDLVEAAIYAQYTEAQITEVEDYVANIPAKYPDAEYDLLGMEFKLASADAYPIRTYDEFQYNLSKDAVFSDPMAAILENFSRIAKGENVWMQLIIEPIDSSWKEKGIALAKDLMSGGGHGHHGGGIAGALLAIPDFILQELRNIITWNFEGAHGDHGADHGGAEALTPGMKTTIEFIEDKLSKIGFKSKMRLLYSAKKNVFSPNRCVEGFVGAMGQFSILSSNAIVPHMGTHAHYDSKHKKSNVLKNSFMSAFQGRKMKWAGCDGYVLNIEELATIWHFPLPFVKTPMLQKAGHKKSEPPAGLPTETSEIPLRKKGEPLPSAPVLDVAPDDLPFA